MRIFLLAAALVAAPAFADEPLGPSGMASVEPFVLTAEYAPDYKSAEKCSGAPKNSSVFMGKQAIYVKTGKKIEVFLDEYARRFALDYCWN